MSKDRQIYYLDCPDQPQTGGHRYNAHLREEITRQTGEGIVCLPQMYGHYRGWRYPLAPLFEAAQWRKFRRQDVVFYCDTAFKYHSLLQSVCRSKKICVIHHFEWLKYSGLRGKFLRAWMNAYYRRMDALVIPSPFTMDMARRLFPKMPILYIPLPFEQRYEPHDDYEAGNLLYVGTIEHRKGLHLLVEALSHIRRAYTLHIVGTEVEPAYGEALQRQIASLGLQERIVFHGRVPYDQLSDFYRRAELFVFPSQLEGYGMVLVEAMQHGLPIVAFDNTAMPYSITDGENGYLAPNRDTHAFAERIERVLGNPAERARIQEGIRQHIRTLKTEEDFARGVTELIQYLQR